MVSNFEFGKCHFETPDTKTDILNISKIKSVLLEQLTSDY